MRIEKHPDMNLVEKNFPQRRRLIIREGGSLWLAERAGLFYIISDEGTMADFLMPGEDDDLLAELVKVYAFDSEHEREFYIKERGWQSY